MVARKHLQAAYMGPNNSLQLKHVGERETYAHANAHAHARNLPSPEALISEIEEGAVNQRSPSGVVSPSSRSRLARYRPGRHLDLKTTDYATGVGLSRNPSRRLPPSDSRLTAARRRDKDKTALSNAPLYLLPVMALVAATAGTPSRSTV